MTMNIVTLNPASVDFTVDGSGNYAVKHWLNLEAAALRFDGIPEDAEIVRSYIWSQQMVEYPATCYVAGTSGLGSASFSGTVQPDRAQVVAMIEVR